jgi:hypothetical protein
VKACRPAGLSLTFIGLAMPPKSFLGQRPKHSVERRSVSLYGHTIWLFAGNDAAGQVAADWYALLASVERYGVDPQHYLTSVLAQLPTATDAEFPRLLPDAWQRDLRAAATSPDDAATCP